MAVGREAMKGVAVLRADVKALVALGGALVSPAAEAHMRNARHSPDSQFPNCNQHTQILGRRRRNTRHLPSCNTRCCTSLVLRAGCTLSRHSPDSQFPNCNKHTQILGRRLRNARYSPSSTRCCTPQEAVPLWVD